MPDVCVGLVWQLPRLRRRRTGRPMNRNDEGGMDLDSRELRALSYLLLSRIADDIGGGRFGIVEWEDVPELSEGSWEALSDQFKLTAATLMQTAHADSNIDPRFIWEQVS